MVLSRYAFSTEKSRRTRSRGRFASSTVLTDEKTIGTLWSHAHVFATALEGKVRLEGNPPVPPTKFVEGSGKSFNTIPPNDFSYFEMVNKLVQLEPATSTSPELLGQLAAIGIVKGKPFNPDARMKKILTDAAAVGNAAGRALNWRSAEYHG